MYNRSVQIPYQKKKKKKIPKNSIFRSEINDCSNLRKTVWGRKVEYFSWPQDCKSFLIICASFIIDAFYKRLINQSLKFDSISMRRANFQKTRPLWKWRLRGEPKSWGWRIWTSGSPLSKPQSRRVFRTFLTSGSNKTQQVHFCPGFFWTNEKPPFCCCCCCWCTFLLFSTAACAIVVNSWKTYISRHFVWNSTYWILVWDV